jgi:hypothetical protein
MSTAPSFSTFLSGLVGPNWVVAARITDRLRAKYGDNVKVLTPARYRTLEKQYRQYYGDPNDPVRAELYRTLLAVKAAGFGNLALRLRIDAALAAEVSRA